MTPQHIFGIWVGPVSDDAGALIIKMCGIRSLEDAYGAAEAGANWLGFNFWERSKRVVSPERAAAIISRLPNDIAMVGVFVNSTAIEINRVAKLTGIDMVQLHGDETDELLSQIDVPAYRAIRLGSAKDITTAIASAACSRVSVAPGGECVRFGTTAVTTGLCLVDAWDPISPGGTGRLANHDWARQVAERCPTIVAGGLTPDNVHGVVLSLPARGVDVAGGIEQSPGVKNRDKMFLFVENARKAWQEKSLSW